MGFLFNTILKIVKMLTTEFLWKLRIEKVPLLISSVNV